jgi:hypothetical protein
MARLARLGHYRDQHADPDIKEWRIELENYPTQTRQDEETIARCLTILHDIEDRLSRSGTRLLEDAAESLGSCDATHDVVFALEVARLPQPLPPERLSAALDKFEDIAFSSCDRAMRFFYPRHRKAYLDWMLTTGPQIARTVLQEQYLAVYPKTQFAILENQPPEPHPIHASETADMHWKPAFDIPIPFA